MSPHTAILTRHFWLTIRPTFTESTGLGPFRLAYLNSDTPTRGSGRLDCLHEYHEEGNMGSGGGRQNM